MNTPARGRPEDRARADIDCLLTAAGWLIQNRDSINIEAGRGIAIREFLLAPGYGYADYLLYVDGCAAGVVEAKKTGVPLTEVELQTDRYIDGLPPNLPAPRRPLPFCYQSTGVETRFTSLLEPDARSRPVFGFHRPETLAAWLDADLRSPGSSFRGRLRTMPPLSGDGLWDHQHRVIANLEQSLARNHPRALIHMTMGSGKTFTACNFTYRLIAHAGARRVLFLVDRRTLGRQALNEFQQFSIPGDGRKFTEIYNVQLLSSNTIDPVCRVVITTIQRLYSILKGEQDYDSGNEDTSAASMASLRAAPEPIEYNPAVPVETFDVVVTDECHRSIYNLWRQVLEYFDAFLIGLTATPSKNTLGFFNQNVMPPYTYADAVADGVNVDFDVYRINTRITSGGARVESGYWIDRRDRLTRARRAELLDTDLSYTAQELNRDVVAPRPLERQPQVPLQKLLEAVALGATDQDLVSSLAARLARLDRRMTPEDKQAIRGAAKGVELTAIVHGLVDALDPDRHEDTARQETGLAQPPPEAIATAARQAIATAIRPLRTNPELRDTILAVQKSHDQVIDTVSKDEVTTSGYSQDAKEKAASLTKEFERYLADHKDEIEALQILYNRPYRERLTYQKVRDLADAIRKPHPAWTTEALWRAYETLDRSKVRSSPERVLSNVVSLVKFATGKESLLAPFPESVRGRFANWIAEQLANGAGFTDEQIQWLTAISEHVATSMEITPDDLEALPFSQQGGLGRAYQLFGERLRPLLDELNEVLVQ